MSLKAAKSLFLVSQKGTYLHGLLVLCHVASVDVLLQHLGIKLLVCKTHKTLLVMGDVQATVQGTLHGGEHLAEEAGKE